MSCVLRWYFEKGSISDLDPDSLDHVEVIMAMNDKF